MKKLWKLCRLLLIALFGYRRMKNILYAPMVHKGTSNSNSVQPDLPVFLPASVESKRDRKVIPHKRDRNGGLKKVLYTTGTGTMLVGRVVEMVEDPSTPALWRVLIRRRPKNCPPFWREMRKVAA
jgi:hypothetical protein